MKTQNLVLVGCGGVSNAWIPALQAIDGIRLVGLVDIRSEAAETFRERHRLGKIPVADSLGDMLDKVSAEWVIDCTVPAAHKEITLLALERGCHVLGEKPISDNLRDALVMAEAAEASGKLYAVNQNRRYGDDILRVKNALDSGIIGRIETLNADFYIGAHFGGFRDEMPHVLLNDMAIHSFDQARFLSGLEPEWTFCHEYNPRSSWYAHDSSAVALFQMTDGAIFNYRGSWCAEGADTSWYCRWRIIGEKGTLLWDGARDIRCSTVDKAEETFSRTPIPTEIPAYSPPPGESERERFVRECIRCLEQGNLPATHIRDNLNSLGMVFAAIESAERGTRVYLEDLFAETRAGSPPRIPENESLGYGDTPVLASGYRVHDGTRPQPPVVVAPADSPPDDAIVLFDGSATDEWVGTKDGGPCPWKQIDGDALEVVPGTGNIQTTREFGDCQLHVEFSSPEVVSAQGQGRGNSGIFLMGRYEIQVLDNFENPTYPDGTVGAVYGQTPPMANPMRPPGEWNVFEILWKAPVFRGERLVSPARVSVLLNQVALQHATVLEGPTEHKKLAAYRPHPPKGVLMLQDHGDPVRFRNIWLRELPELRLP